jgi:hypothetical protein
MYPAVINFLVFSSSLDEVEMFLKILTGIDATKDNFSIDISV